MSEQTSVATPSASAGSEPGQQSSQPARTATATPAYKPGNSQPAPAKGAATPKTDAGGTASQSAEPAKARSLDELRQASASGKGQYTDAEKKRVQLAARFGLKSDAEIDAKMAEIEGKKGGKPTAKGQPKGQPSGQSDGQAAGQPKPAKAAPPKAATPAYEGIPDPDDGETSGQGDAGGENLDAGAQDADLSQEGQAEHDDPDDPVKILGIKNPEDKKAIGDAVRYHKERSDRFGQLVNGLKAQGIESAQHLNDSLTALKNVDATVKGLLAKGSAGIAELYRIMQVDMPAGLQGQGQGVPAQGQGGTQGSAQGGANFPGQAQQAPLDFAQAFGQIGDDAVVDGRFVKQTLPQLLQQSLSHVVGRLIAQHVQPLNQRFEAMIPQIENIAQQTMRSTNLNETFRNVRTAMSAVEQVNPGYKLQDSIENIWHESVLSDGTVAQDHHPEWPKLAGILREAKEAQKQGYANLRSYLADRLLRRGQLGEHVNKQVAQAKVNQARDRQRRLQPGLAEGRAAAPEAGFKMPSSPEEARHLKETNPAQYAIYKQRLARGEF